MSVPKLPTLVHFVLISSTAADDGLRVKGRWVMLARIGYVAVCSID